MSVKTVNGNGWEIQCSSENQSNRKNTMAATLNDVSDTKTSQSDRLKTLTFLRVIKARGVSVSKIFSRTGQSLSTEQSHLSYLKIWIARLPLPDISLQLSSRSGNSSIATTATVPSVRRRSKIAL